MDDKLTVILRSRAPDGANGMALLRYVRRAWPMMPAFAARDYINHRQARVNGARACERDKINAGDEIALYVLKKHAPSPLRVINADTGIVAFIKPAGLPVDIDSDGVGEDTAISRIKAIYPTARLVHRLDAGTGGVMFASTDDVSYAALTNAFREHTVEKQYRALVLGHMSEKSRALFAFLAKNADSAIVKVTEKPVKGAKPIETRYSVVSEFTVLSETITELEINIPTGRTHQIRAHMAYIGHPVIGDDKYGDRRINKLLRTSGLCLWCLAMTYNGITYESEKPEWKLTT